ncbi:hypothetical protein WA158_001086 [Blastocystis sp. Blastoise]
MFNSTSYQSKDEYRFTVLYSLKKSTDLFLIESKDTIFTYDYPCVSLLLKNLLNCFISDLNPKKNEAMLWELIEELINSQENCTMFRSPEYIKHLKPHGKLLTFLCNLLNNNILLDFIQVFFLSPIIKVMYKEESLWRFEDDKYIFVDMIRMIDTVHFQIPLDSPRNDETTILIKSINSIITSLNNSLFYFDNYVNEILTTRQENNTFALALYDSSNKTTNYIYRSNSEPQTCVPAIILYSLSWIIDNSNYQTTFYLNQDISCIYILRNYYSMHACFPDYTDIGSVWALLFSYLTLIPDSLFPSEKAYTFLVCQFIYDPKQKLKAITNLLRDIPVPHKYLLERLFTTLTQLYHSLGYNSETHVFRRRLCEMFGSVLIRHSNTIYLSGGEKEASIDLIEFILLNSNQIFLGIQKELEILDVLLTNKKNSLLHINSTLSEIVTPTNEAHKKLLKRLWYSLVGEKLKLQGKDPLPYAPESPLWREVGFQRDTPWTDFRGGGVYALENLVYFVENYPNVVTEALNFDSEHFFPFAIVGVNITGILAQLLGLDASPEVYSPLSHVQTPIWILANEPGMFNQLYCMTMLYVLSQYKSLNVTFLTIGPILQSTKIELRKILATYPDSLKSLAVYIEQLRKKYDKDCSSPSITVTHQNSYPDDSNPHSTSSFSLMRNNGLSRLSGSMMNDIRRSNSSRQSNHTGNDKLNISVDIELLNQEDDITDLSIDNYENDDMIISDKYINEQFWFLPSHWKILKKHVPLRYQGCALKLIYKLQVDGASCATLIEKSRGISAGLLIIRDAGRGIFGGFITESLKYLPRYYGSGESFVFSFSDMTTAKVYKWSQLNSFFIHSDETHIGMGGGGSFAFYLDTDLNDGYSGFCKTYNSECLSTTGDFQCYDLELWSFVNAIELFSK